MENLTEELKYAATHTHAHTHTASTAASATTYLPRYLKLPNELVSEIQQYYKYLWLRHRNKFEVP